MFPDARDAAANIQKFQAMAGIPGVIGCIDGSRIPIRGSGGNGADLYCRRRGYFSINIRGICDANLKFMSIIASWPGSVHGIRIFEFMCAISSCKEIILATYLETEKRYNTAHAKTRIVTEHAFEILKKRFACLSQPLRAKLENTVQFYIT
nr:putative nuclease HARBI1 [Penaeus vannamei]